MTSNTILAITCLVLVAVYEAAGQERFDAQAEREKMFEDKAHDEAQVDDSKRSPTGKFLLLKGEIRDDDDSKSDMSLLDRLMPTKTKVIIDGGAAFPFPPPPPPPPMLPQFILPPPPHAFIPSVIIGPSSEFAPLPLGPQQEPKADEEPANGAPGQQNFFGTENSIEQQRPNFENMMRPSGNDGMMMGQQQEQQQPEVNPQRFQNMIADMQQQQQQPQAQQQLEWTPGRFRMMGGNGDTQQQESAQRFQGMLPLDMQPQDQSPSAQRFQGGQFDMQQDQQQPQRFQGMPTVIGDSNSNSNMQPSRFESQQDNWSNQRFQGNFGGDMQQQPQEQGPQRFQFGGDMQQQQQQQPPQQQQEQGPQRFQFGGDMQQQQQPPQQEQGQQGRFQLPDFNGGDIMMNMMNGKIPQQMMGAMSAFQFPEKENPTGKSNKKNKDKPTKGGQKGQDIMPEPEPPGCSCGPMFHKSGWGHLKRCAKRCAAHQHHHSQSHFIARSLLG